MSQQAIAEAQQAPASEGLLVMLVGLPASGKSVFGRRLAARLAASLVQTDVVRKKLFARPRYTLFESNAVYRECHRRLRKLVAAGEAVVFDATNLDERRRRDVYRIAEDAGARLVVALTWAPPDVVRQRMTLRSEGVDPLDHSDADWAVYRRMKPAEPIPRPHFIVNSTVGLEQAVELVARRSGGGVAKQ